MARENLIAYDWCEKPTLSSVPLERTSIFASSRENDVTFWKPCKKNGKPMQTFGERARVAWFFATFDQFQRCCLKDTMTNTWPGSTFLWLFSTIVSSQKYGSSSRGTNVILIYWDSTFGRSRKCHFFVEKQKGKNIMQTRHILSLFSLLLFPQKAL